ncbi:MAG: hypothetical protein NVS9B10_18380 [Nevskia sp.]
MPASTTSPATGNTARISGAAEPPRLSPAPPGNGAYTAVGGHDHAERLSIETGRPLPGLMAVIADAGFRLPPAVLTRAGWRVMGFLPKLPVR